MKNKMARRLLAASLVIAALIAMPAIYVRAEAGLEGRQSLMQGAKTHAAMGGSGMSAMVTGCAGMMNGAMSDGASRPNELWR
ncbi:MAG: hypothetical protein ACLP8B_26925 [Xanthobacteraceae bacterium]